MMSEYNKPYSFKVPGKIFIKEKDGFREIINIDWMSMESFSLPIPIDQSDEYKVELGELNDDKSI